MYRRFLSDKRQKRKVAPLLAPTGLWDGLAPDCPSLARLCGGEGMLEWRGDDKKGFLIHSLQVPASKGNQECGGSGGEGLSLDPRTSLGPHGLWNACPDIPRCPGECQAGISWCWLRSKLSPQPKAAGWPASPGTTWELQPDLRGPQSTKQRGHSVFTWFGSQDQQSSQWPQEARETIAADPMQTQGEAHLHVAPGLLPRLPPPWGHTPRAPSCHPGKVERGDGSLRASMYLKGLF